MGDKVNEEEAFPGMRISPFWKLPFINQKSEAVLTRTLIHTLTLTQILTLLKLKGLYWEKPYYSLDILIQV